MMATLNFNLPEEQSDLQDALDGTSLRGNAQSFDNYLRGLIKHTDLSDEVYDQVEKIRDRFHEEFDNKVWE